MLLVGCKEVGGSQVEHMMLLIEDRDVGDIGGIVEELAGELLIPGSVFCFELNWRLGSWRGKM